MGLTIQMAFCIIHTPLLSHIVVAQGRESLLDYFELEGSMPRKAPGGSLAYC